MAVLSPLQPTVSMTNRLLALFALLGLAACSTPPGPVTYPVSFQGEYHELTEAHVQTPVMANPVTPKYPFSLKRESISGEVTIDFIVEVDGRTSQVQIKQATHLEFGLAAKAAVEQWKYHPGLVDGVPARFRIEQVIPFDVRTIDPAP